ncbi:MAG: hypothetical protein H8D42_00275, partial [Candidatus Marinimicrobia bacterium]|nr:hypothetical protein [Candidatus Neomarinimicrobiota bacterium]
QKMVGIHRTKIYEILKSLSYKGLCSEKRIDNLINYEAVSPNSALAKFIKSMEERLADAKKLSDELQIIYSKSEKHTEPFEYIEIIYGNENIHNKYLKLLKFHDFELLNFTRPPFASATKKMYIEQEHPFLDFLKRGGKSRSVYEVNENSEPRMFKNVQSSTESDDVFRIAPKLPLKMFIFDRKTLLIADQSTLTNGSELSMTVIKQKTTVDGYIALFEFIWEQATEYEDWIVGKEALMELKLMEFENDFAE